MNEGLQDGPGSFHRPTLGRHDLGFRHRKQNTEPVGSWLKSNQLAGAWSVRDLNPGTMGFIQASPWNFSLRRFSFLGGPRVAAALVAG